MHLGSRAVGGAALVFTEAAAVTAEGRISPQDLGIWSDEHIPGLRRITDFLHLQGSAAGIQLAHAGRKASTRTPWFGEGTVTPPEGGWEPVAPTAEPFADGYPVPRALTVPDINGVVRDFEIAARRALDAGFDVIEIHAAHGYLLHEFLSPLVNTRTDEYGGSFDNRVRLTIDVADAVRRAWPEPLPVFVRISATDWVDGGWDLDQSVELARRLRAVGIDLIDCSSGGAVRNVQHSGGARLSGAVRGTDPPRSWHRDRCRRDDHERRSRLRRSSRSERADLVLLARQMLRDPYFAAHAAEELGVTFPWPVQYLRARAAGVARHERRDEERVSKAAREHEARHDEHD